VIGWVSGGIMLALLAAAGATAAEQHLILGPETTAIRFRLGATLHTVAGTARLERGEIVFDAESGAASGEIVVDSRSLETGNEKRDRVMHAEVLESAEFPRIVFVAERLEGNLVAASTSEIRLHGRLRIHGTTHPTEIVADVRIDEEEIEATGRFSVPYVALGMRDPSKLVLRVAKEVEVEMRFSGRLEEAASPGEDSAPGARSSSP
jgi:polyisoprenoid-binding protein YceI